MNLRNLFKKNLFFTLPYLTFLFFGGILIIVTAKDKLHLLFNSYHTNFANTFFEYLTFIGDGWMALFIALALLFIRYGYTIIIVLSYFLSSVIVQSLKHFVFNNYNRPAHFFKNNPDIYLIPNLDNNIFFSFPSGHSATAFAIYFCLALFTTNKWLKFGFFIMALIAAYSRVYLSQHFFEDIYAGSIIGFASTLFVYILYKRKVLPEKLNGSLIKRIKT